MPAISRIKLRRDTAANWTAANPTLATGEPGYETDTGKLKVGDGSTAWNLLGYFAGTGLSTSLTSAHIFVGNGSNQATDVAVSGDLTLANTGAATVAKIQGTVVSGTTGTTNAVFSNSPTLVTPVLGTPTSGNLSNCTNIPVNQATGTLAVGNGGTGQTTYTDGQLLIGNTVGNTLTKATLTAGSNITITNGNGSITIATTAGGTVTTTGTPASGNLTQFSGASSITNGDLSGDVTTSGTLATTVAKIAGTTVSGTTGTTNVVFSNSPTLVTPVLGTPTSGTLTNCTGYDANNLAGTTLNSGITTSSLTSFGSAPTLSSPTINTPTVTKKVTAKTANYTLLSTDSGQIFTNTGAAGTVNFTLPAESNGLFYEIIADAAQPIAFVAGVGDTIRNGAEVSSSGGSFTSDGTSDALLRVVGIAANKWRVEAIVGSWTVA